MKENKTFKAVQLDTGLVYIFETSGGDKVSICRLSPHATFEDSADLISDITKAYEKYKRAMHLPKPAQ